MEKSEKWLVWCENLEFAMFVCNSKEDAEKVRDEQLAETTRANDIYNDIFEVVHYGISNTQDTIFKPFGNLACYYKTPKTQIEWK